MPITAEDQPDLKNIKDFYQIGRGNFWVVLDQGRVRGTISLLDLGHQQGALRKMFVDQDFRGDTPGIAGLLLETLLNWARLQAIQEVLLGTTPKLFAAHRFYEKKGFAEIAKDLLPSAFPVMKVDTRFYHIRL
ncbi:GNAT family N-acetyltransferase [bacterium]|nr:GNAT family N-acetyltransferase [bacterium]